jgi:hypothetical protein
METIQMYLDKHDPEAAALMAVESIRQTNERALQLFNPNPDLL